MRKIKIAQIGTSANSHGSDVFNTLKRNSDVFEIVGYVMPENEREKFPHRMADFEGYCELTLEEILERNIEKLKKRYPEGFSTERSINREE